MVLAASPAQVGHLLSLPAHVIRAAARRGEIFARRSGTRVLVDIQSAYDWYKQLPEAYPLPLPTKQIARTAPLELDQTETRHA